MSSPQTATARLWEGLQGTWQLARKLHSANAAEPSGRCFGSATFTSREPSVLKSAEGSFELANKEMLYSEQGEFEMASVPGMTNMPRFNFSRKYVWRLQEEQAQKPLISIWFVKPGTETIDYLFHKIEIQPNARKGGPGLGINATTAIEGCGGHLCIDDFYTSSYTFNLLRPDEEDTSKSILSSWQMLHEVKGPKKDQIIETTFTRV